MLDFNSKSHVSDRINWLVDSAIDSKKEEPREYLGASIIGHQCERHIQYYWMNLLEGITPTFPPRVKRIFDRGYVYEDKARQWLKGAGFLFGKVKGKGDGFVDGRFSGHVDGIITGFKVGYECPIKLPVLWECKCLGDKGWKKMAKDGLKEYTSTTYWAQVHVYMHYLGLTSCLFTSVNADTMEMHHEVVEFDQSVADLYRVRAHKIIALTDMEEMVPRCTNDKQYIICKWCDYAGRCWK